MASNNQTNITVTLVEQELFEVEFLEQDLLKVELKTIDIIYKNIDSTIDEIYDRMIYGEPATKISATKFQTIYNIRNNSLQVFLNGLKLLTVDFTKTDLNIFSLSFNTEIDDDIEVNYIKDI